MPATRERKSEQAIKETTVTLGVRIADLGSRRELEDYAIMVQEAVDVEAAGIALGAAVGCSDDPPASLEVIFTVRARSVAEVHHRIALVVSAIEVALPRQFEARTRTRCASSPVTPTRSGRRQLIGNGVCAQDHD